MMVLCLSYVQEGYIKQAHQDCIHPLENVFLQIFLNLFLYLFIYFPYSVFRLSRLFHFSLDQKQLNQPLFDFFLPCYLLLDFIINLADWLIAILSIFNHLIQIIYRLIIILSMTYLIIIQIILMFSCFIVITVPPK